MRKPFFHSFEISLKILLILFRQMCKNHVYCDDVSNIKLETNRHKINVQKKRKVL